MHFARPEWLWLLAVMPLWAVRAARWRARKHQNWARLGQLGRPCGDGSTWWMIAAACVIVGLAQPRWGRSSDRPLPPGHDVVLAVDVSRSMGAGDAVPDRLGVAVETAESLVRALGHGRGGGDRVAVVAFAGRGVLRCPLTENLGAAVDALRTLRPGDVTPGGTDLGAALSAALEAFDENDHAEGRSVVLFSDGEDHVDAWKPALERVAGQAVIVHAVAVGDAEAGHPVPVQTGPGSRREPLSYRGEVVQSKRVDTTLEEIASATGGAVLKVGLASADLGSLYRDRIEPEARARHAAIAPGERAERFSIFLLMGLSLSLLAYLPRRSRAPARRAWIAIPVLALAATGAVPDEPTPAALIASGRAAYEGKRYEEAATCFECAIDRAADDPVPRYDAAAALFQLERFEEAAVRYHEARERAGPALRTKIDFALGNTAVALGQLSDAIRYYDECLASTARGPGFDEVRRDAAINREFVIEHAKRSVAPPDDTEGPRKPPPAPKAPPDDAEGRANPTPRDADAGSERDPSPLPSPSSGRGPGGAGGEGPAPPGAASPEGELSRAMENLRESRRRRIDDAPPANADRDRKDW